MELEASVSFIVDGVISWIVLSLHPVLVRLTNSDAHFQFRSDDEHPYCDNDQLHAPNSRPILTST